ncbi:MAG TPA: cation:proton antiporter [Candidatus Babeliales bacterium]|jgi:Kef-type K+ transport system membrane component KefB|nr:cation:proton antiporter [Candidatus Babeliales bacterium]
MTIDMHNQLTIPAGLLVTAGLSPAFVAQFALFVAIILMWTIAWGKVFKKLCGLPVIAGRIIAGILLGPSLCNIAEFSFFAQPLLLLDRLTSQMYSLASYDVMLFVVLLVSSALTVSYLLWIAGHETDVHDIFSIGPVAVSAGVFGAVLPIIMIAVPLYYCCGAEWSAVQAIGMGLIFAATSVSIPVAMLFAYNKMHLKSSKAALGAAVADDIFAVILLALFSLSAQAGLLGHVDVALVQGHGPSLLTSLFCIVFAFVVMSVAGYYFVRPFIEWLKRSHLSHLIAPAANGIMLIYFAFAEIIGGLAGITGAYFAGLFHRMGDHRHGAEKVISPFVNAFLLPLFLGSIGLQLDVRLLSGYDWLLVIFLLVMAIISKLLGCWLATALSNCFAHKDSYRWTALDTYLFGSSMVARGEVGLVVTTILFGSGIILPSHYVIAIVVIVLTTVATPIMLAQGFERLALRAKDQVFSLNIGLFSFIGTTQMFHIIMGCLEKSGMHPIVVQISDGSTVANLEEANVKVVLNADNGILFEGDKEKIEGIVRLVKESIVDDLAGINQHMRG